jgi:hypothetical protein
MPGHHQLQADCVREPTRAPTIFAPENRCSLSTRGLQRFDESVKRIYLQASEGEEEVSACKWVGHRR